MSFTDVLLLQDVTDHSGLRLWMTPTLRQYDAGVISVGAAVSNFMIIPPGSGGYLTQGMCHGQCLAEVSRWLLILKMTGGVPIR